MYLRWIEGLINLECWKIGRIFQFIKTLSKISGRALAWLDGEVMYWKKKIKVIKVSLLDWHKRHRINIEQKIKESKERLRMLDLKGELESLKIDKVLEKLKLSSQIFSLRGTSKRLMIQWSWNILSQLWLKWTFQRIGGNGVMECVCSTRTYVLVNERSTNELSLERGMR